MDEHRWSIWAWGPDVPRWGYDGRCTCGVEASGRWADVEAAGRAHLDDMQAEAEQAEAEQAHG